MINPAHHLVRLFDSNGLKIDDRATTMPGIPRVGDEVRIHNTSSGDAEEWRVIRVIWEGGLGNWVEVWISPPGAPE